MELLELGRVLRERREAIEISKAAIARRAEVSESYVVMVEQGSRRASKAVLERWAAALGWDEASTRQVLTMAGHITQEQDSPPLPRSALTSGALHFPQPRRMEKERVIQELLGVLNRAEVSEGAWRKTLELMESSLEWLKFRLEDVQELRPRLRRHMGGALASDPIEGAPLDSQAVEARTIGQDIDSVLDDLSQEEQDRLREILVLQARQLVRLMKLHRGG